MYSCDQLLPTLDSTLFLQHYSTQILDYFLRFNADWSSSYSYCACPLTKFARMFCRARNLRQPILKTDLDNRCAPVQVHWRPWTMVLKCCNHLRSYLSTLRPYLLPTIQPFPENNPLRQLIHPKHLPNSAATIQVACSPTTWITSPQAFF